MDSATLTARLQRLTTAWDAHIYRLLTAWTETAATWNDADGTGPGAWASGAFSASDYDAAQAYGPLDVGVAAPPAVDVTGLARSWLESGRPNHGVALIGNAQNTNRAELYDSEDAGLEPKLTLNWAIPAEPATRAVLAAAPTSVNTGAAIQVSLALTATQTDHRRHRQPQPGHPGGQCDGGLHAHFGGHANGERGESDDLHLELPGQRRGRAALQRQRRGYEGRRGVQLRPGHLEQRPGAPPAATGSSPGTWAAMRRACRGMEPAAAVRSR